METKPRLLNVLDWVSLVLFVIATGMVFFYAPTEAIMGQVQRVFYFHVATAWVGLLGFIAAGLAGIGYLRTNNLKWDNASLAAVEISLIFFAVAIVMGSIWARPSWGTYWTWEPRLTTATVTELIYAAYLLLRQGLEDPERRARFSAVYTILGCISVPITFVSIRLFRTIHPVVIGNADAAAQGGFSMTPAMFQTMMFSVVTFSVIFVALLWHRIRLGNLADKVEQLRLKLAQ